MHAQTAGGGQDSYGAEGYNRFTIDDFLRPFEATAALCRMHWRPPFVVHASHMRNAATLEEAARNYRAHILALLRE